MIESMCSNVFNRESTVNLIKITLDNLRDRLSNTVGPFGSTTIIESPFEGHVISKDGYTVLKEIKYNNEVSKTILDIVKNISKTLVKEVGDGSTSSILVAAELYKVILEIQKKHKVAPKEIIDVLSYLEELLSKDILACSTKINEDNWEKLVQIAAISNNNDNKAGQVIADLYKEVGANGFISLENSKGETDYFKINHGIKFDGGYLDKIFATEKNKVDSIYRMPYVFITNGTLEESDQAHMVENILGKAFSDGRGVVLIAKNYDFYTQEFLKLNRMQNGKNFMCLPLMYPLPSQEFEDRLEDLAVYLGTTVFDKNKGHKIEDITLDDLGVCDTVKARDRRTEMITEEVSPEVEGRILEIEDYLNENENDLSTSQKFTIKQRIAILEAKTATIYVGGKTVIERDTRKFLMEDAIYACESALKHGYIIGGNLIIPMLLNKHSDRYKQDIIAANVCRTLKGEKLDDFINEIIDNVYTSFKSSFRSVLYNKIKNADELNEILDKCIEEGMIFNLITHEYEEEANTKIINSAMTDIQIMKASFSMMSLLATSNQFITQTCNINL